MSRIDGKYLKKLQIRYRNASKKERTIILDEVVKTTDYSRKYAIALLNGKRERAQGPIRRPRKRVYGAEEAEAIVILADLFDGICSKLLRAAMDAELPRLYGAGVIRVSSACYEKLMQVSLSTMDRFRAERRPPIKQSRGFTKPGTLLNDRIPIRTWADWTEDRPGFCEMDLVDHSGGRVVRTTTLILNKKNWSIVRRTVGYYRYDTPEQLKLLNTLYNLLHRYTNFFIPVMKLKEKTRIGSRVKRIYDDPQTPYARALASPHVSDEDKAALREAYGYLDLVQLRMRINQTLDRLLETLPDR